MSKQHRRTPAHPQARPDLALVVIARNEARCIARCLNSAKDVVSRMLVLDTGSTDDTMAIARACGAQVHQAPWNDDFSQARNTALELADADWNLVLDADEWLESGTQALCAHELRSPFLGFVVQRSEFQNGGQLEEYRCWVGRLLPRGVRYEGRIHEQPVSALPTRQLPLVIGHDGYLAEQRARKIDRNQRMLQQELEQSPLDPYYRYQLGTEYEGAGDFKQAAEQYTQALEHSKPGMSYRKATSARLVYCLAQSRQFEQAILSSSSMMDECHDFPDYFFALGNLFLDMAVAHPEQSADQWLPMAESAWLRCLEIGERPDLNGVAGRGSYQAAHNLAVLYEGIGDSAKAQHYAELAKLKPGHSSLHASPSQERPPVQAPGTSEAAGLPQERQEPSMRFTQDWFSANIPSWNVLLDRHGPRKILEIGAFEGRSTCHVISVMANRHDLEIHCIDTWQGGLEHSALDMNEVESNFDHNVRLATENAKFPVKLRKIRSTSQAALCQLNAEGQSDSYDLIYIDGSHETPDVLTDAVIAFPLLKIGGLMIFDDYLWGMGPDASPLMNPKMAIDSFLNCFQRKMQVLPQFPAYQLYCRKLKN